MKAIQDANRTLKPKKPQVPRDMGRDRPETEQTLLDAVGAIVRDKGFLGLGINAIAAKAGVSKVLIYRYFGDLDGLLAAWAIKNNYWGNGASDDLISSAATAAQLAERIFSGQIRSLRASKENREIIRWFLAEENPLSKHVMAMIEERGKETMATALKAVKGKPSKRLDAGLAIIVGGIYYLSLIADRTQAFNGIGLESDDDWRIIGASARDLALALFVAQEKTGRREKSGKGGEK